MIFQKEYKCNNPECGDGMVFVVIHDTKTTPKNHKQVCAWCGIESEITIKIQ